MKNFLIFFNFIFILFSNTSYALEKGKWIFVKDDEYCYIGSIPIETDLSKEKKRGDTYILVYKMVGNKNSVIQIEAGYNYKLNKDILIKIDNTNYGFWVAAVNGVGQGSFSTELTQYTLQDDMDDWESP